MADLKDKIEAEFEQVELLIKVLPPHDQLPRLHILVLVGVSTLLHNFYNGMENILKQIFKNKKLPLPTENSWHKELLNIAA